MIKCVFGLTLLVKYSDLQTFFMRTMTFIPAWMAWSSFSELWIEEKQYKTNKEYNISKN